MFLRDSNSSKSAYDVQTRGAYIFPQHSNWSKIITNTPPHYGNAAVSGETIIKQKFGIYDRVIETAAPLCCAYIF